jgi:hypothetical protein
MNGFEQTALRTPLLPAGRSWVDRQPPRWAKWKFRLMSDLSPYILVRVQLDSGERP